MSETPVTSSMGKTWHDLPPEIHTKIISFMPFNDRLKMKQTCSYAHKLCSNLPNQLDEVDILINNRGYGKFGQIKETVLVAPEKTITVVTTDGTRLKCNAEESTKFSEIPNYESDGKFIAFIMILRKSRIKRFKILMFGLTENMRADFERLMAESDMQVDTFDFHTADVNLIRKFLEFSKKPNPAIEIHGSHLCRMIFESVLDIPAIQDARSIRIIKMHCAVSDDQLLGLTAKKIQLAGTNITSNGINQLLKEFLEGKRELRLVSLEIVQSPSIELEACAQDLDKCNAMVTINEHAAVIQNEKYQIFVELYDKKHDINLVHITVEEKGIKNGSLYKKPKSLV